ncbi:TlpA disulfide reductase family protein [Pedobacter aquatilis]|uniref:TlpA family protein disulfide reductase n=1 Tax=Pedobacter aquatilis TaxID=351343 RepID=UPI0025B4EC1E|nr:TlpA disulfide reductase family protein [Pedobacter aquatilis]MDN3587465.1 TlpA disulfide reductase family protein [Pedobacter aquatilis]
MKKILLTLLTAILFYSCNNGPAVFTLTAKNFSKNATVSIISAQNWETLKVENIKENEQTFQVNLPKEGFAELKIENGMMDERNYWFYLESGKYDLILDGNDKSKYPFKETRNKETNDFTNFYAIKNSLNKPIKDSLRIAQKSVDEANLININERVDVLADLLERDKTLNLSAIEAFAKKHPKSSNTIFLLDQLGVTDLNSVQFGKIFNYLDQEQQNSKAGKKLLEEITLINKMKPGNTFERIAGETPDGKTFSKEIFKKLNLVFVWTSYNHRCRENNKQLRSLYDKYKNQGVEFIGVSLDNKRNWWVNVIRDDKLTWPQFSDLKGAKSPNAKNIGDYKVPYFMLLDKRGKILLSDDLSIDFLEKDIERFLKQQS